MLVDVRRELENSHAPTGRTCKLSTKKALAIHKVEANKYFLTARGQA